MLDDEAAPESLSTSLNLLACDAILRVTFAGLLTSEQYGELLLATQRGSTAEALTHELLSLGKSWEIEVDVQPVRRLQR